MNVRAVLRSCLILAVAAILAAPLALHQSYTAGPCPTGTHPVVNTDECVSGPGGQIVVNKVGKLMNIDKCATYKGREYDEVYYHVNNSPTPASTPAAAFNVSNDADVGEIAVIVDTSNAIVFTDPAGTRIDTVDAVKQYMVTHVDDKDFIFFFPNFNHAEGSFHNHIKNDVQGINVPIQDNSATYLTQNLKSLALYRNFNQFPADVNARIMLPTPNNDSPLSLLAQESGHRWAAWVRRDKDPGPRIRVATDLLGRNEAHWCFYLNSDSEGPAADPTRPGFSSMEGNSWRDNGNLTFTTIEQSDGYSRLDQYLMGFRSPQQLSFFKLNPGNGNVNPDCAHQPYTSTIEPPYTVAYPKINVDVQDIIRVEGNRNPDFQTSQKNWRVAFVIIAKAGTFPTSAEIAKVDNLRLNWEPYFRDWTGAGRMFTALGPVDMDLDGFASNLDCDEQDPAVHPGATEVCNAVDDDCDGLIDDGFDVDGDLYTVCNFDCNDNNININPGAVEIWNGLDDNCDAAIDNVNLVDADNDGYYANPQPPTVPDCNDSNPNVHPGLQEIVNGFDDNCNGWVDCAEFGQPTFTSQTDSGPRGNDGFDNDCNGVIDG